VTPSGILLLTVGLVGMLWADVRHSRLVIPFKLGASTGFLLLALDHGALDSRYGGWILVGLCLSWVGDAALLGRSEKAFLLGLGSFLLAHLAFAVAFLTTGPTATRPSLLFGLVWLALVAQVAKWLLPHVGTSMRLPVIAYVIVISVMVVLSGPAGVSRESLLIPLGAASFAVSDIAVARNQFVAQTVVNRFWGLPLYYAGQVLLALSIG